MRSFPTYKCSWTVGRSHLNIIPTRHPQSHSTNSMQPKHFPFITLNAMSAVSLLSQHNSNTCPLISGNTIPRIYLRQHNPNTSSLSQAMQSQHFSSYLTQHNPNTSPSLDFILCDPNTSPLSQSLQSQLLNLSHLTLFYLTWYLTFIPQITSWHTISNKCQEKSITYFNRPQNVSRFKTTKTRH